LAVSDFVEWGLGRGRTWNGGTSYQGEDVLDIPKLAKSASLGWATHGFGGVKVTGPTEFEFLCSSIGNKERHHRRMDITWLTDRIAVGGGIWTTENMAVVADEGVTHIIDMQIEFDDTTIAEGFGIEVLWNPTDDDFEFKPAALFRRGVEFAERALATDGTKLFIHCAAGVHRAPMMTLAVLASMGWTVDDAMELIEGRRPVADFAEVYVESVEKFLEEEMDARKR
jgi:protein-tyrosine phosphatase